MCPFIFIIKFVLFAVIEAIFHLPLLGVYKLLIFHFHSPFSLKDCSLFSSFFHLFSIERRVLASEGGRRRQPLGPSDIYLCPIRQRTFAIDEGEGLKRYQIQSHIRAVYNCVDPGGDYTVQTPTPGAIAVYELYLKNGLRFPLHPFIPELLRAYKIALCQLMPNALFLSLFVKC